MKQYYGYVFSFSNWSLVVDVSSIEMYKLESLLILCDGDTHLLVSKQLLVPLLDGNLG